MEKTYDLTNFADRERYLSEVQPIPEHCYRMGQTHSAYGWSANPKGHWGKEQIDAYNAGYKGKA